MFPGGINSYSLFLLTVLRSPLTLEGPNFQRPHIARALAGHVFKDPIPAGTPEAACMEAIICGDEQGALTQLEAGAAVNACDEVGLTLMHHAAQAGMFRLMCDLKRRGADINARSVTDESVLTYAILSNTRAQTVRNLLPAVIDFMIANHADIDARDSYQMTAVMHAARFGNVNLLDQLLQRGHAKLSLEDANGYNALCYAAVCGQPLTVNYLLQAGMDPRLIVPTRGCAPSGLAHEAFTLGHYPEEIKENLQHCINRLHIGEAIADAYEILGETPAGRDFTRAIDDVTTFRKVHLQATATGDIGRCLACLQILGEIMGFKEPPPDSPEYHLLASCYHNNVPALQQVLERNVPLDLQNSFGRTALTLSVIHQHHETAQILLNCRASTEIPDVMGLTPLMLASQKGDTRMVDLLLARHANPLATDWQGLTAYDYAMIYLHDDQASRDLQAPDETLKRSIIPHPVASRLLVAMQEWRHAETQVALQEKNRHVKHGRQLS